MPRLWCVFTSVFAVLLVLASVPNPAAAAKLEVLHEFAGPDGCDPVGGLVVNPNTGVLFGTAKYCGSGNGVVFSLTPPQAGQKQWSFAKIHDFKGGAGGSRPIGIAFVSDAPTQQLLAGATEAGPSCPNPCGTVFHIGQDQFVADKWNFHRPAPLAVMATKDGNPVEVDLVPNSAPAQNTLQKGRRSSDTLGTAAGGSGAVYSVDFENKVTLLYDRDVGIGPPNTPPNNADLGAPPMGVALAADGSLVGTSFGGGASGYGTVFNLDLIGCCLFTGRILASFPAKPGPTYPLVAPTLDSAGNIYGSTWEGGVDSDCPNSPGCGTIWKVDAGWETNPTPNLSVLHSFAFFTNNADGQQPNAPLVIDETTGTLYGTTRYGGTGTVCGGDGGGCGTAFQLDTGGNNYKVLWEFPNNGGDPANCHGNGCPADPQGTLAFFQGSLYGTSYDGGKPCPGQHYLGCGTVWKLTP